MREDRYWVSIEGELKITDNWEEEYRLIYSGNWKEISAEEYALFCQVIIYALKNNVIND